MQFKCTFLKYTFLCWMFSSLPYTQFLSQQVKAFCYIKFCYRKIRLQNAAFLIWLTVQTHSNITRDRWNWEVMWKRRDENILRKAKEINLLSGKVWINWQGEIKSESDGNCLGEEMRWFFFSSYSWKLLCLSVFSAFVGIH